LIPFNYLGWAFKLFGKRIYPDWVFLALSKIVQNLKEEDFVLDIGAGTGILVENFVFDFDPEERKGKMIYIFERFFGEPGNFFSPDKLKEYLKKYGFESQFIKKDYRYVLIAKKTNLSSQE